MLVFLVVSVMYCGVFVVSTVNVNYQHCLSYDHSTTASWCLLLLGIW